MSPADLDDFSAGDLKSLVLKLFEEVAELRRTVAAQRDEIARLKDGSGRPNIKPSGMDKATEPKEPPRAGGEPHRKGSKTSKLSIDEERTVKVTAPPQGSRLKAYTNFVVQDLVIHPLRGLSNVSASPKRFRTTKTLSRTRVSANQSQSETSHALVQFAFTISNSTMLVAPVMGTITPGDLNNNLSPVTLMKYIRSVLLIASLDAASTRDVSLMPSGVCSPVTYLPVQETSDFIAATDSASVSVGAAGGFRVESTNNSQIRSEVIVTKPATFSPSG
jgi:hypothetical protein